MRTTYQLVLALLVMAVMTLMPSAANASGPGVGHAHSHFFHNRAPRVHNHGSVSHRS
jgi:hypothetical protein